MLRKLSNIRHARLYLLSLVVVLAGLGIYWGRYHKVVTAIPSAKPTQTLPSSSAGKIAATSPATSSSNNSAKTAENNAATTSAGPISPFGNFVSNHKPGGSAPTSETSVCNTTPGATCYIQLTKGSEVKKLDTQTADAAGATYWYWDTTTAGVSSGSWTITAVASLNGQTKTTTDSVLLEAQ